MKQVRLAPDYLFRSSGLFRVSISHNTTQWQEVFVGELRDAEVIYHAYQAIGYKVYTEDTGKE